MLTPFELFRNSTASCRIECRSEGPSTESRSDRIEPRIGTSQPEFTKRVGSTMAVTKKGSLCSSESELGDERDRK